MAAYQDHFKSYIRDLAAHKPTPGGGSALALILCLGVALIEKAIHFSQPKGRHLDRVLTRKKERLAQCVTRCAHVRKQGLSFIDRDGKLFGQILKSQGGMRQRLLKQNDKMVETLGSLAGEVFVSAVRIKGDIKKNIVSDFAIGIECMGLVLKGCMYNLTANEILFKAKAKGTTVLKGYLQRWENYYRRAQ